MEIDGIDKSIVYSTIAMHLNKVDDDQYLTELYRAYNDWIAEYCSAVPDRLFGIAFISVEDTESSGRGALPVQKDGAGGSLNSRGSKPGQAVQPPYVRPILGGM